MTIDGGTPVTFHTMTGTGTVNVTVPKKTLGFTLNGESLGTARVAMENDVTIEIPHDYNLIPSPSSHLAPLSDALYVDEAAEVTGINRAFKIVKSGGQCRPRAFIVSKYANTYNIVQWEFHIKNTGSANLTVLDPFVSVRGITDYFVAAGYRYLTDQMYVLPGMTNVYVFRADMEMHRITMSLAYDY